MPEFASFDEAWRWFEDGGDIVVADDAWAESWAHGRAQYLTFLARVEDAGTLALAERAQERLARVAGVVPFSRDYLHVTLAAVGFQVLRLARPDEVTRDQAIALAERAVPLFQGTAPATFRVGPVNVLNEAIVLELYDDGRWDALRRAVNALIGRPAGAPALPHVTIARCVEPPDREELLAALRSLRAQPGDARFSVRRIEFVRAWLVGDFPREEPELETLRRYGLQG
ncbi:MAG TPA: 2'-5' RNA ligase family protein [Dehalococcoidia bacterium]|nr:2'-5' RNA ligase family protein [Dehalococcoidia bacterium]